MRASPTLAALAVVAACASHRTADVHAQFPSQPGESTSSLVLLLGEPRNVAVSIDGRMVVDDVTAARVVVAGVPVGTRDVFVATHAGDKQLKVDVEGDHAATVPLGVRDSGGPGVLTEIASTLATVLLYALLR